jgi:death-on-curing protein
VEVAYLELADFPLIAEAILEVPAEEIARYDRIELADSALASPIAGLGEVDVYPEFAMKVAVLCWHLIKNHPLPDGNKRAAFLASVEFAERNGWTWNRSPNDPDETDDVFRGVAAGRIDVDELCVWIRDRISQ